MTPRPDGDAVVGGAGAGVGGTGAVVGGTGAPAATEPPEPPEPAEPAEPADLAEPRRRGRAAGRSRALDLALGAVVPLLMLLLWQGLGSLGALQAFVPTPVEVARAFGRFVDPTATASSLPGTVSFDGQAAVHIGASVWLLVSSYVIALLVGIPAGAALALSPLFRSLTDPMVQGLRAIPIFAWLPLAIVWFGLGAGSSRFLVVIGAVFPVLVATADAVSRVPTGWVEAARMLGTLRRALLRRVYLPAALPGIVVGCRLGVSLGWMSVIVGEFTSGRGEGVGAFMQVARQTGSLDEIVVGMVCFALLGLASDSLIRLLTARWTAWARS